MKVHVVLVRSEYASNVGAAARAVANMGGDRLILIDPKCRITTKAKEMAAGAQKKLRDRIVYKSWQGFYAKEGEGLRLALTRRSGRQRKVFALTEKLKEAVGSADRPQNLYLIFGPEADGLDAEDLAFVNFAVHLPIYGEFQSLNLAQAVMLSLFLAKQAFPPKVLPAQLKGENVAPVRPLYFPDKLIREWLSVMGFDIQARKSSAYLTLRRLFLQNQPTQHEVQVLEAILQQNIRKLKQGKS